MQRPGDGFPESGEKPSEGKRAWRGVLIPEHRLPPRAAQESLRLSGAYSI